MIVRIAGSDADLERACTVLVELRTAFDPVSLLAQVKRQQQEGFQVAIVEQDGQVLCVAGFRVGTSLAWGRHIYVDDLVTTAQRRSTGAGKAMIDWLKAHARELGCTQLHLDSGVQRFAAHRFYLREGFDITAHHFGIANLDR